MARDIAGSHERALICGDISQVATQFAELFEEPDSLTSSCAIWRLIKVRPWGTRLRRLAILKRQLRAFRLVRRALPAGCSGVSSFQQEGDEVLAE